MHVFQNTLIVNSSTTRAVFTVVILCGFLDLSGQSNLTNQLAIKASYFGEFVMHPGLAVGVDYSLLSNEKNTIHWDSEIGWYHHRWNNNAVFIQSTIGNRRTTSFSAFVDVNLGLGYMLSSPAGDVYVLDQNGLLIESNSPWYSGLKPSMSLLFGWNGNYRNKSPLLIQGGFEAYWQVPVNHKALPHAALRLGIIYRLNKNKDEN